MSTDPLKINELYARVFNARYEKAKVLRYDDMSDGDVQDLIQALPEFSNLETLNFGFKRRFQGFTQRGLDFIKDAVLERRCVPTLKELAFVTDNNPTVFPLAQRFR